MEAVRGWKGQIEMCIITSELVKTVQNDHTRFARKSSKSSAKRG